MRNEVAPKWHPGFRSGLAAKPQAMAVSRNEKNGGQLRGRERRTSAGYTRCRVPNARGYPPPPKMLYRQDCGWGTRRTTRAAAEVSALAV
jgi:hypothetical protein